MSSFNSLKSWKPRLALKTQFIILFWLIYFSIHSMLRYLDSSCVFTQSLLLMRTGKAMLFRLITMRLALEKLSITEDSLEIIRKVDCTSSYSQGLKTLNQPLLQLRIVYIQSLCTHSSLLLVEKSTWELKNLWILLLTMLKEIRLVISVERSATLLEPVSLSIRELEWFWKL